MRVNPNARAQAGEVDAQFAREGLSGALHCVRFIVKDDYDTANMPTTAGTDPYDPVTANADARRPKSYFDSLDREGLDGARIGVPLAYPTWDNPPRLQGDLNTPHGNNAPRLSPLTGLPAITVPMGFTYGMFPAATPPLPR